MVAGACIGAAIGLQTQAPLGQAVCLILAGGLGGLLPDIDTATSKLGRKLWPASMTIQLVIGHRTLFHAPILYLALYFVGLHFAPAASLYILAATLGAASHLVLDILNPSGIPLLWPWKKRFHLARFNVGGWVDILLQLLLILLLVILISNLHLSWEDFIQWIYNLLKGVKL